MKCFLIEGYIVLCCFAVGASLVCYGCRSLLCPVPSALKEVTCEEDEMCDIRVLSSGGSTMKLGRGCIEVSRCGKTEDGSVWDWHNVDYKVTHHCCDTWLCNSSTSAELSFLCILVSVLYLLFDKLF